MPTEKESPAQGPGKEYSCVHSNPRLDIRAVAAEALQSPTTPPPDRDSDNPLVVALAYAQAGWAVFPVHSVRDGACTCGNNKCDNVAKHPLRELVRYGLKSADQRAPAFAATRTCPRRTSTGSRPPRGPPRGGAAWRCRRGVHLVGVGSFFPVADPFEWIDNTRKDVQEMRPNALEVTHIKGNRCGLPTT